MASSLLAALEISLTRSVCWSNPISTSFSRVKSSPVVRNHTQTSHKLLISVSTSTIILSLDSFTLSSPLSLPSSFSHSLPPFFSPPSLLSLYLPPFLPAFFPLPPFLFPSLPSLLFSLLLSHFSSIFPLTFPLPPTFPPSLPPSLPPSPNSQ